MIVIHCMWIEGSFFIWGEKNVVEPEVEEGGDSKEEPITHPFQASTIDIIGFLREVCSEDWKNRIKEDGVWIMLPSINGRPKTFQDFVLENEMEAYSLSKWWVKGIVVQPHTFVETFASKSYEELSEELTGYVLADDCRFWMLSGRFLLSLLCRQKFIPSLNAETKSQIMAFWQPVFEDPEDRRMLKTFINSMPPVCRGAWKNKGKPKDYPTAHDVYMDYLKSATNEVIRHWLIDMHLREENSPIERRWLHALHNKDQQVEGTKNQLIELMEGIRDWTAVLRQKQRAFRACFRLEEPKDDSEEWRLSFHLQATDDPDMLVSAQEVWQEGEKRAVFLNRTFDFPQERFLEDLGRALKIYPPLERGLYASHPTHMTLTVNEAYYFLKEASILLQEGGFGVITPLWWREKKKRGLGLQLKIRPSSEASKVEAHRRMGLDSFVEYEWGLSLGDQQIDYKDLRGLGFYKKGIMEIKGRWVEFDDDEMAKILQWLKNYENMSTLTLKEALHLAIQGSKEQPTIQLNPEGWLKPFINVVSQVKSEKNQMGFHAPRFFFKERAGAESFVLLPAPTNFKGKLRPYQVIGYSWLVFLCERGIGACLADDMGLGKTIQLIAMLLYEREKLGVRGTTLLICPTSLIGNWYRELSKFAPNLKVFIHHGIGRITGDNLRLEAKKYDLVISTYSLIHRDHNMFLGIHWEGIVLDEAQNIKNPFAKQTQAIHNLKGNYRVALTGTPIENRLQELWSIMEFLNPGYLGSRESFRQRFAIPIERHAVQEQAEGLRRLVQPLILRRLKADPNIINDLPDKQEMKVYCTLSPEQAVLYEATAKEMMERIIKLDGIERKGLVLAYITKLKQICNHPALFNRDGIRIDGLSGKLVRLTEMLEEILSGNDRCIIFTQYVKMGKILKGYLRRIFKREILFMHGGIPRNTRDEMVRRFQQGEVDIFILSLKVGGVGLNLTQANHVFHFDRWWNPAVENQATDRAFRIGQKKNVQVHKLICLGTLEEKIDEIIERKKFLAEEIVRTGDSWLTELSNEELANLVSFRWSEMPYEWGD